MIRRPDQGEGSTITSTSTLGDDLASMTGAWVLDVSSSDTMEEYLRCMGMPRAGIEAQLAGELIQPSRNVFAIDDSLLLLHKRTRINDITEAFELEAERVTPAFHGGVKRAVASLLLRGSYDAFVVETLMPTHLHTFRLVEIRRLLGDGSTHMQEIHLHNLDTGIQSTTKRTWKRVTMTQSDRQELFEN
ncbi:unnamed protein product [Pylaiella littoralis]